MSKKEKKKQKPDEKEEKKAEMPEYASKKHEKFDRKDFFILLGILVFSFIARSYWLSYPKRIYFDEMHYVPAARSYLDNKILDPNGIHPPLGKQIMAMFMKFFGDKAVGWRAGSVAMGLVMIVVIYLLALAMFKNRFCAAITAGMLGVEFLHIVQSRIATLDIYIAGFILIGYYFAWLYVDSPVDESIGRRSFKYLIWSAFFFGLATAVKLSGLGGAAGTFLFIGLALWRKNEKFPFKQLSATAVIFAVVIAVTFVAVHAPLFEKGRELSSLVYTRTFKFHYTEQFRHPYLSQMWQWPIVHRPIWYLWQDQPGGYIRGVIAIGNLLFWWSFIPVLFDMLYRVFKKKNVQLMFILCGYLPLYLFWLSSLSNYGGHWHFKGGFFYYMLPCVPFMALALTETLKDLQDTRIGRISTWAYLAGLVIFLIAFYPILAGTPIKSSYFEKLMRLNIFKTWL